MTSLNFVIAKVRDSSKSGISKYQILLTDQTLYQFPDNLSNAISFCSLNSKEYSKRKNLTIFL